MRNYYIFKSGKLSKKDNTLKFTGKDDQPKYIPVNDVDTLFLFGEISLNTKLLNFFTCQGIIVHVFNYYGYYSGSYMPRKKDISGSLTVKQAEHYLDAEKRIHLAGMFVKGAVAGIIRNLGYHKEDGDIAERIEKIKIIREKIKDAHDIHELMGYEGNIRQHYYACFEHIIKQDLKFEKRTKRPPQNEINSLISFLNSLVYSEVLSQIYRTQLDPTISFLHELRERRYSLSLDISEIFKPLLGDRIIFRLLNLNQIDAGAFIKESKGMVLTDDARKMILTEFSNRMKKTIKHRTLKRNVSYRTLIRLECYKLIKHLIGDAPYKVFKAWW
ncbi:MAG: type I-B CRISPR-associated endonuclease Cas1 [Spirochaetales bacterium]|nr:type I-B CRISPR-associated endonuclease Cas1 [Spirochaetales bacterium]